MLRRRPSLTAPTSLALRSRSTTPLGNFWRLLRVRGQTRALKERPSHALSRGDPSSPHHPLFFPPFLPETLRAVGCVFVNLLAGLILPCVVGTIGLWVTSCRFLAAARSSPPCGLPLAPLPRPKGVHSEGSSKEPSLTFNTICVYSTIDMSGVRPAPFFIFGPQPSY